MIPGGAYNTTYVISAPGSYVLGGNRSANTAIFVIEIAVYAYLMNKKDVEYGIREEG